MSNLHSIVEYHGSHDSYKCGYCKSSTTNYSHGMWAHSLTVSDYQDLIDRGWRRSGQYCYKPTMDVTCCPMYTIRCRMLNYKPTKSQKKILKRFNKYLIGEIAAGQQSGDGRKMSTSSEDEGKTGDCISGDQFVESNKQHSDIDISDIKTSDHQQDMEETEINNAGDFKAEVSKESESVMDTTKSKEIKKGVGADPGKGPSRKAKDLRIQRKLEKLKAKGIDPSTIEKESKNKEKQLEDFINELPKELKHKLQMKLVRTTPPSMEWLQSAKESFELYTKYQTVIHNDKPEKYSQFKNFLVQSPLQEEHRDTGPRCGYGSFHQQYWLDNKLVAVGVIDILPKCVSSVYFFYDPDYMSLSLGTYGALREIAFTRELHKQSPDLQYYYMGFYIHSCRKMRYKGNFAPSDLLCPETYKWFPITECIPKLELSPYSRLNPDVDDLDDNCPSENDLNYIPILVNGLILKYKVYKRKFANKVHDDEEICEYARLVGAKSAKNLILVK